MRGHIKLSSFSAGVPGSSNYNRGRGKRGWQQKNYSVNFSSYAAVCMLGMGKSSCQCVLMSERPFCADSVGAYRYDIDMTKCIYW